MDLDLDLVALAAVPELGPVSVGRLVSYFGSASAVWAARESDLKGVDGVTPLRLEALRRFDRKALFARLDALGQAARVITLAHGEYPEPLRALGTSAPPVLYVMGQLEPEDMLGVTMVGTRTPTAYGIMAAQALSADLGRVGLTVLSGMARGIDTVAHKACLEAGGRTIAILGSGIDVPYPRENSALMRQIAVRGAVLTEFPPGTQPLRENFPQRNRLLSAMALGVVVVEAAPKSGSLITATYALEQGKEVFAVPGSIQSRLSMGPNELLRQGARVATSARDILCDLGPLIKSIIKEAGIDTEAQRAEAGPPPGLSQEEEALYAKLKGPEPVHIDQVAHEARIPAHRALALLLGLELKGIVKQLEGKRFYLA